ncbi:regenerating islet-derived protein 3-gamma-like isoform X2 [Acanthaster planci]|uniref:Regenerating islet-derived protein 3-gamma-like isoform X2 n=1 Tax=Acanthaster planci TaxID=133434 RepID=A0A8B8A4E2_ACAPL|nr:regenerating islet-derived protein 3-gamma-like isoform X2 [Acanthaster planci]
MDPQLCQECCLVVCIGLCIANALGSSSQDLMTTDTVCPSGFTSFESSCYRLVSDSPTDGYTARNECQNLAPDSHLGYIQSQAEQTFLQEWAKEHGVRIDYWFGLTYTSDVDHPMWLDGSPIGNYTAWDRFGPLDEESPCVRLRRSSDYLWNDRNCDNRFGYICELERSDNDVVPLPTPTREPASPTSYTNSGNFKAGSANMAAPTDNYLLRRLTVASLIRCSQYCLKYNACASFNYKLDQSQRDFQELLHSCELLSKQFSDDTLIQNKGFKHYRRKTM